MKNKKDKKQKAQAQKGKGAEQHFELETREEKHKHRSEEDQKRLVNRLKRIEGQIRGIQTMVEEERYCIDILTQCAAVQAALNAFNKELLSEHIETCVLHDVRTGNSDEAKQSLNELVGAIQKLMK